MVSRNLASKGFETVKLQTPVHTQSTSCAFRNVFFFPLYDVVLLGNQMQINITLEKMEKEYIITFIEIKQSEHN